MDLVRNILLRTEEAEGQIGYEDFVTDCWSMQDVAYHVEIMFLAGLLDTTAMKI